MERRYVQTPTRKPDPTRFRRVVDDEDKRKGLGRWVPRPATRQQNDRVQGRKNAANFEDKNEESNGGGIDNQSRHHQRYAQQQSTSTVQQTSSRRNKLQTDAALFCFCCRATQD